MLMLGQMFQGRAAWDGDHVSSRPEETIGPCAGAQKLSNRTQQTDFYVNELEKGGTFALMLRMSVESNCAWMCMCVRRLYWLLYVLRQTGQGTALGTLPALW